MLRRPTVTGGDKPLPTTYNDTARRMVSVAGPFDPVVGASMRLATEITRTDGRPSRTSGAALWEHCHELCSVIHPLRGKTSNQQLLERLKPVSIQIERQKEKQVKKVFVLFVTICLALNVLAPGAMAQARRSVVQQAYYALSTSANGTSPRTLNGNYVGSWNWLDSDWNAYNTVKNYYNYFYNGSWTCFASDFGVGGDPCPNLTGHSVQSFYSNPGGYGYDAIVPESSYGRGGQCVYFANLVVYRSGVDKSSFPSLPNMWGAGNPNMQQVQIGDVIVRYNTGLVNHVAIVVEVYASGGKVTSVDVVDSDFFPDNMAHVNYPEVITRHTFPVGNLQGYFRIWKVPGY
jgi:hypothetical protein